MRQKTVTKAPSTETRERITATELAKSLSDILSRVYYQGESFVIERNGQVVAALMPPESHTGVTLGELVAKLRERGLLPVDDKFADDLEAIQASQPLLGDTPWDSWSIRACSSTSKVERPKATS